MNIITLEYFNHHNKGGIIEVPELPTQAIDMGSFYRLTEDTTDYERGVYFYENDEWILVGKSNILRVEELPSTPEYLMIYDLIQDSDDYVKGVYYPVIEGEAVTWLRLDNETGTKVYEIANSISYDGEMIPQLTREDIVAIADYIASGTSVIIKDKYDIYYNVIRADRINEEEYQVEHQYFNGKSIVWTYMQDGQAISLNIVEPLLVDKEYEVLETVDKTVLGAINELNRIETYQFKGYVSTTEPTGTLKEGELWWLAEEMPEEFPILPYEYKDGAWVESETQYTPNSLDLWANLENDHGYYWFGNHWNLVDIDIEVDGETIDFNDAGQIKVADEAIKNKHINPELKATVIEEDDDDQLATEGAVYKELLDNDNSEFELVEIDENKEKINLILRNNNNTDVIAKEITFDKPIIKVDTLPTSDVNLSRLYLLEQDVDERKNGLYYPTETDEGIVWIKVDNDCLRHGETFPDDLDDKELFVLEKDIDEDNPKGLYIYREGNVDEDGKISGIYTFEDSKMIEACSQLPDSAHGDHDVNFTNNGASCTAICLSHWYGNWYIYFKKPDGIQYSVCDVILADDNPHVSWNSTFNFSRTCDFGETKQDIDDALNTFLHLGAFKENEVQNGYELLANVTEDGLRHAYSFPDDLKDEQLFVLEQRVDENHPKGLYVYHDPKADEDGKVSGLYTFNNEHFAKSIGAAMGADTQKITHVNFVDPDGKAWVGIKVEKIPPEPPSRASNYIVSSIKDFDTMESEVIVDYSAEDDLSSWGVSFVKYWWTNHTLNFGGEQSVDDFMNYMLRHGFDKTDIGNPYFELIADVTEDKTIIQVETLPDFARGLDNTIYQVTVDGEYNRGLYYKGYVKDDDGTYIQGWRRIDNEDVELDGGVVTVEVLPDTSSMTEEEKGKVAQNVYYLNADSGTYKKGLYHFDDMTANGWTRFNVNLDVDDTTIEINDNKLRIKEHGVDLVHLKQQSTDDTGKVLKVGEDGYFDLEDDLGEIVDVEQLPYDADMGAVYRLTKSTEKYSTGIYAKNPLTINIWSRTYIADKPDMPVNTVWVTNSSVPTFPANVEVKMPTGWAAVSGFTPQPDSVFQQWEDGTYYIAKDNTFVETEEEINEWYRLDNVSSKSSGMIEVDYLYNTGDYDDLSIYKVMVGDAIYPKGVYAHIPDSQLRGIISDSTYIADPNTQKYPFGFLNMYVSPSNPDLPQPSQPLQLYYYSDETGHWSWLPAINHIINPDMIFKGEFVSSHAMYQDKYYRWNEDHWEQVDGETTYKWVRLDNVEQEEVKIVTDVEALPDTPDDTKVYRLTVDEGDYEAGIYTHTVDKWQRLDNIKTDGLRHGEEFPNDLEDGELFVLEKTLSDAYPKGLYLYHKGGSIKGIVELKDNIDSAIDLLTLGTAYLINFPVGAVNCYRITVQDRYYPDSGFHKTLIYSTNDASLIEAYKVGIGWTNELYKTLDLRNDPIEQYDPALEAFLKAGSTAPIEPSFELLADHTETEADGILHDTTFPAELEDKQLFVLEKDVDEDNPKGLYIYHAGSGEADPENTLSGIYTFTDGGEKLAHLLCDLPSDYSAEFNVNYNLPLYDPSFALDGFSIASESSGGVVVHSFNIKVGTDSDAIFQCASYAGEYEYAFEDSAFTQFDFGNSQNVDNMLYRIFNECAVKGEAEVGYELLANVSDGGGIENVEELPYDPTADGKENVIYRLLYDTYDYPRGIYAWQNSTYSWQRLDNVDSKALTIVSSLPVYESGNNTAIYYQENDIPAYERGLYYKGIVDRPKFYGTIAFDVGVANLPSGTYVGERAICYTGSGGYNPPSPSFPFDTYIWDGTQWVYGNVGVITQSHRAKYGEVWHMYNSSRSIDKYIMCTGNSWVDTTEPSPTDTMQEMNWRRIDGDTSGETTDGAKAKNVSSIPSTVDDNTIYRLTAKDGDYEAGIYFVGANSAIERLDNHLIDGGVF